MEVGAAVHDNWEEMTPQMKDEAGKDMMKKWKTLRDNFVRELRILKKNETGAPATKKKKYIFFDQLSFLTPYMKPNDKNVSNIPPLEHIISEQEAVETVETTNADDNDRADSVSNSSLVERQKRQERVSKRTNIERTLTSASKNITSLMQESIAIQRANTSSANSSDKSGNKAFLMSFLPVMDSLPPLAAFDVRMQLTEVFRNAIMNQTRVQEPVPVRTQMIDYTSASPLMFSGLNSPYTTPTPTTPSIIGDYDENTECSNATSSDNTQNQPFNISEFVNFSVNPGIEPSSSKKK
ncbi:hypothetical protein J6590_046842 [Homalodisca vitripennis]|nr:hypothetical protein J6590_046842 [Homalodisca vitripennis]